MPILPSGLKLAISRDALFYHGGNWFKCPEGHFWYWTPDLEIMGEGPYILGSEILRSAVYAPVPATIEEVKQYIYVLECEQDEKWGWRGEWLDQFPRYRFLSVEDNIAWNDWVASASTQTYLEETIVECQKLAELNQVATGTGMPTFLSGRHGM